MTDAVDDAVGVTARLRGTKRCGGTTRLPGESGADD